MIALRCKTCGVIGQFRSESLGMVIRLCTEHKVGVANRMPDYKPEDHIIYVEER